MGERVRVEGCGYQMAWMVGTMGNILAGRGKKREKKKKQ